MVWFGGNTPRSMDEILDEFWSNVDRNGPIVSPELGPCWLWKGTINRVTGYGQISYLGRTVGAHRLSFFLAHGHFPKPCGLHRCDNRACVRVEHISEGTQKENLRDCVAKGRYTRWTKPEAIAS